MTWGKSVLYSSSCSINITRVHSNEDLIWCVKTGGLDGFLGASWVLIINTMTSRNTVQVQYKCRRVPPKGVSIFGQSLQLTWRAGSSAGTGTHCQPLHRLLLRYFCVSTTTLSRNKNTICVLKFNMINTFCMSGQNW